jgi:hypothetical protein
MAAAPDDDARRTLAELEAKLRELERELLRGYEPESVEADPFAAAEEEAPEYPPPAALRPDEPDPEPAAAEPATPATPLPLDGGEPDEPEPATPPVTFDAAEWTTPETREHAAPERPAEPEPTYEGGLARDRLPAFEPAPADEAEPEPEPEPAPKPEPEPEPVARLDHDALGAAHGLLATLRTTIEEMGLTAARVTAEAQAVADDHGRTLGRMARAAQAAARAEDAAHEAGRLAATVVVEAGPFADAGAVTALRDTLASQPGARDAYVRGVEGGRAVIEVHLAPPPP